MKKIMFLTIVLVLVLTIAVVLAAPEDLNGQIFPDFSVKTISGSTFSLSESLKTHDLVLINFWATWCGPCRMEFPFLEAAWEQYSNRVDVVALSIEETDSFDVLRSFANDYSLSFSIGRDESGIFNNIVGGNAIPTTLIVDKSRQVVAVEVGSKSSAEEFTVLFDMMLPLQTKHSQASADRCVLIFHDAAGNPVPGVTVAFCNGEYTPAFTNDDGCITFDGDPNEYHVHLLDVPYGYSKPWEELHIFGEEYNLIVTLYSDN